jgi:leucyl aminopeptidase
MWWAVVPAAENSVDANAIRPGDVIGSYSKKSIEVLDTDAEGRLILADGLAYIIKKHMIPSISLTLQH